MRKYLGLSTAIVALGCTVVTPLAGASATDKPTHDVTDAAEAQRVDTVDVSGLKFEKCFEFDDDDFDDEHDPFLEIFKSAECSTLAAPLNYDKPGEGTYNVEVLRQPAKNQAEKIGTLFLNPGGPGGSAWITALSSGGFLSPEIIQKFDVVGVEPRGIGINKSAQCFKDTESMVKTVGALMETSYPEKAGDYAKFFNASRVFGQGCATQSPLQRHMSTAQVARDMDVVRRAVGDDKLNYLGFSYGTAIGQYYANMFPDRVRAVVNDGVVDAKDWTGTDRNGHRILDERLGSALSADAAFREVLRACDEAGSTRCRSAANDEDPSSAVQKWDSITEALKSGPIVYVYEEDIYDEEGNVTGTETVKLELTQKIVVGTYLSALYQTNGTAEIVDSLLADLYMIKNGEDPYAEEAVAAGTRIQKQRERFEQNMAVMTGRDQKINSLRKGGDEGADEEYYESGFDGFSAVVCTDGSHPMSTYDHMRQADMQSKSAPIFGRTWAWSTVQCSRDTWSAYDKSAYWGSFDKKTSAPVMYVGNQWDPATAQAQAEKSAKRQPGSTLITSRSWGHTAYGTSECVTSAVDSYLLTGKTSGSKQCTGDYVPFSEDLDSGEEERRAAPVEDKRVSITGSSPAVPVGSTMMLLGVGVKK